MQNHFISINVSSPSSTNSTHNSFNSFYFIFSTRKTSNFQKIHLFSYIINNATQWVWLRVLRGGRELRQSHRGHEWRRTRWTNHQSGPGPQKHRIPKNTRTMYPLTHLLTHLLPEKIIKIHPFSCF